VVRRGTAEPGTRTGIDETAWHEPRLTRGPTNSLAASPSSPSPRRAELLHVLMLPDFERADRIGEFWGYPESRAFAELLIECEEDRVLRAVLVGMLRDERS
jgi:hypothetical protein